MSYLVSAVKGLSAIEENHLIHSQNQEQDLCFCQNWNRDCQYQGLLEFVQENGVSKDSEDVREA